MMERRLARGKKPWPYRVGIIGAGQLARMLASAGRGLGINCVVWAEKSTDCALQVAHDAVVGPFADEKYWRSFVGQVDLITVENEFLDLALLSKRLKRSRTAFLPKIEVLSVIQSKMRQKKFFQRADVQTLPWSPLLPSDLKTGERLFKHWGGQGFVIKQAEQGYDGKGVWIIRNQRDFQQWREKILKTQRELTTPFYSEPFCHYVRELAVVAARDHAGKIAVYEAMETNQAGGICRWVKVPGSMSAQVQRQAQQVARQILVGLSAVGTMAVEFFEMADGRVVVNEMAPRVHNSGHWTMNGAKTSQFEQHLRAICGFPLGSPERTHDGFAMVNIIGSETAKAVSQGGAAVYVNPGFAESMGPECWVHWYGKVGATRGRKLGHINAAGGSAKQALTRAQQVRAMIKV